MRAVMIVVPDEVRDGAAACGKRKQRAHEEAFVIDRAEEALDFAIRLRSVRAQQVVANVVGRTDLLKTRQAVGW